MTAFFLNLIVGVAATAYEVTEYRLKAAFLFTFAKFVEWPALPGKTFNVCVSASEPFADTLTSLEGQTIHNKPFKLQRLTDAAFSADCHAVFLSQQDKRNLQQILLALAPLPILTVSEIEGFAKVGGMIELVNQDGRVKFDVNLAAAKTANLKFSAQALTLARTLYSSTD